jgi:glycosyltransferase involved in cell wall biosynthesis
MTTRTKVSCIMVSFDFAGGTRFRHFERAFLAYSDQTYKNKELVIVIGGDNEYFDRVRRHVSQSQRRDVKLVFSELTTLAALRNCALDHSTGDIVCQWDDDDISHPSRIGEQIQAMLQAGARATVLGNYIHFFEAKRYAVVCDWRKLRLPYEPGLPGTLLAERATLPRYRDGLMLDEDSQLLKDLDHNGVTVMSVSTSLPQYVYIYHGANVFSERHHVRTACATACDGPEIQASAKRFRQLFTDCRIDLPLTIVDGQARVLLSWV